MLLGILLHAALSFAPIPWPVQDSQQSEIYQVLFAFIHGFRMPLFFMLSGFFTAMLWRKRGLASLAKNRLKRIFLPLVLGCLTIIPAMWWVSSFVTRPSETGSGDSAIFTAVVAGDVDSIRREIQNPDLELDTHEPTSGSSPLCTATFLGHAEIVQVLIDAGAEVDFPNRDLATPLHIAAFMGRAKEAELLLAAGADTEAMDGTGQTPAQLLTTDFGMTSFIAGSFGLSLDEETLLAGRKEIAEQLGENDYLGSPTSVDQSPNWEGLKGLLFQLPVFMHLWFLWFLCWLVVAFACYTLIARALNIERIPPWIVCSPIALLWLVPLTMLPQSFMQSGSFGPDPSIGLLPIPSVLGYYAVFFFFGAVYWEMDDKQDRLGRWWFVYLPLAIVIVFPIAWNFVSGSYEFSQLFQSSSFKTIAANFLQAAFTWMMIFGSIGLFRRILSSENRAIRYISDASYWLYLVHLPLVILAQWLVRDLPIPAFLKLFGITVVISGFLLVTYAYGVRYTLIGRMLNGPRTRIASSS